MAQRKITRRSGKITPMDRGFAVLIMALVGGCIALQAPINAGLGKSTGSFAAATVSFAVGTLLLGAIVVLSGKAGGLGNVAHVEWYYLLGGALGAAYVFSALVLVNQIGAGGVAAATVTGQLTTSVILDQIGFLGLDKQPISSARIAGVLLLLGGTYLIVR
jgi:transporter family-2 protein